MAGPICGTFGLGSVWHGPFSLGNHLHGRRGRGFDAARWGGLCYVTAGQVTARRGKFCPVELRKTTIVLARRPIDAAVVGCTQASWC